LIHVSSNGQKKYGIVNLYAFVAEQGRGNIPVDKDGNPMYNGSDTLYRVYVETKKSNDPIHWKLAWVNGRTYTLAGKFIETAVLEIGYNKTNHEKIILKSAAGNILWNLQLLANGKTIAPPQKTKPGELLMQGVYKNKNILVKIDKLIVLQLPPVQ
jgi:hypothetical protein